MKISYGITVHNEADELNKLLEFLIHKTQEEDEIVICDDITTILLVVVNVHMFYSL